MPPACMRSRTYPALELDVGAVIDVQRGLDDQLFGFAKPLPAWREAEQLLEDLVLRFWRELGDASVAGAKGGRLEVLRDGKRMVVR